MDPTLCLCNASLLLASGNGPSTWDACGRAGDSMAEDVLCVQNGLVQFSAEDWVRLGLRPCGGDSAGEAGIWPGSIVCPQTPL